MDIQKIEDNLRKPRKKRVKIKVVGAGVKKLRQIMVNKNYKRNSR